MSVAATAWPAGLAAFLAALVEFVEALTVVLAVGAVRGWGGAVLGSGAAALVLVALVALFGPLLPFVPLAVLRLGLGGLMLLFGLRWLRKAILRAAGVIALHDEAAAYDRQTRALRGLASGTGRWDAVAVSTAFQITMIEGIEVVFIVIAVGAGGAGLLVPAALGALGALILVVLLGVLVHRPLANVPENTLKFGVGVLLSAFGAFWFGEGCGVAWPGGDWSIPALVGGFLLTALITVSACRRAAMAR